MIKIRPLVLLLCFLAVPVLFVTNQTSIRTSVHQVAAIVWKPFVSVSHGVSRTLSSLMQGVGDVWAGFREHRAREERMAELERQLIQYQEVIRENVRLKKLLEFKEQVPQSSVAARVIGWDLSAWRKTLLINKGSADGIEKDMAVVVPEGLAGRIMEVHPLTARVLLLMDSDSRASVISEMSRVHGVAGGNGSDTLDMRYVNLDSPVEVNEAVLSSGVGGVFPKGLSVGRITSVERDPDGLHLKATVAPFVNFFKIEEVLCLKFSHGD